MRQLLCYLLFFAFVATALSQYGYASSNGIEIAGMGSCPSKDLTGEGRWKNRSYGGSWKVTLQCMNGTLEGQVQVGSSNSCDNFPVKGHVEDSVVYFSDTKSLCGSWKVSIPLKKGPLNFSPDSGRYPGVEIVDWKWENQ